MMNISRRRFLALAGMTPWAAMAAQGCQPISTSVEEPAMPDLPMDPEAGPMINALAVDLYAKLAATKGNVFCSPFSISTALGMTATGAKGKTLEQMRKVFHLPQDDASTDRRFRGLMSSMSGKDRGYELTTANAIWAQTGFPWRAEFKDRVAKYGAGMRDANFAKQAEKERLAVNQWVEEQTKQKIKELFKPGTVDSNTRMILANAIYFKGKWANEFSKAATKPLPFTRSDGTKSDVPMMFRKAKYNLFTGDDLQVLSLPYKGNDLSMMIALPSKIDGLAAIESKLTVDHVTKWVNDAKPTSDLQVYLPKFKIETDYTLNETLKSMGMQDAFSEQAADFSGMHSGDERLFISLVVHKAYVDVNEEGTEAAAATGVGMMKAAAPISKPLIFRADHPFIFAIRHNPSGAILFLGRVEKV